MSGIKTGHFRERIGIGYPAPFFGEGASDGQSTEDGTGRDDSGPDRTGLIAAAHSARAERTPGHGGAVCHAGPTAGAAELSGGGFKTGHSARRL